MTVRFPLLRPFSRGDVWAQTAVEAASFDARAIHETGVPQAVLMENAGRSAAAVLTRLFDGSSVVGFIGSGNNGGDALVALRTLQSWGYSVRAILVADRDGTDPLAHGWPVEVVSDTQLDESGWREALAWADVLMDGVLGTGARGAPRPRQAEAIERLNDSGCPVMALDVPSGIDATTGEVPGSAVRADVTVCFGAPKLGALLHPARALVGRHVTVEIGFPPLDKEDASVRVVTPQWARAQRPRRGIDTHKNRVGRVLVVGGQVGMAGAVVLAARAAFHSGAGLVRVCSAPGTRDAIQAALPEAIHLERGDVSALDDALANSDAVVVGPGLGTDHDARSTLTQVTESGSTPLLLDADALNLAALSVIDLAAIGASRPVLITPHAGEMSRLVAEEEWGAEATAAGRVSTARAAADRFGCTVLFKGAPSVVAGPGGPITVDTQSSSDLAVAGMGDALGGVCGALLAQGVEPVTAGALGLYLSGRAARIAGRGAGLTPSDVVRWLPEALTEAGASSTDLDLPFVTFDADPAR